MEVLFVLILVVVLGIWDQYFRKKTPYVSGQPEAPDLIGDADRGHRS